MGNCVITGLGAISSIGRNVDEIWNNAVGGNSGIREVKQFNVENCYAKLGAEIPNYVENHGADLSERLDKVSMLCLDATIEALKDAKVNVSDENREKISVIMGSCTGGAISAETVKRKLNNGEKVNDVDILKIPISAIASNVACYIGVKGMVDNVGNACAAGTLSIILACELIESGLAEIVIAGGTDSFSALAFSGFTALHALDENACSPLNHSQGINLGEGAGVVVVESLAHAQRRNAKIYCHIAGSGVSSDAHHITAPRPDGEGQMNAMKMAFESSQINAKDITYINAHGTGTPLNDAAELLSLSSIFENCLDTILVSSTKSMIGHCLGAAGALEAVLTIKAIEEGEVPPTIGFDENYEAGPIDFVPNVKKEADIKYAMSNSFAFGGNNASIIFGKGMDKDTKEKRAKRVFITGIGLNTPIGVTVDEFLNNISNQTSGISEVNGYEKFYSTSIAYNVKSSDFNKYSINKMTLRKMDRLSKLLLVSGFEALNDTGKEFTEEDKKKLGLIVGTSDGPVSDIAEFQAGMIEKGIEHASALIFPNTVYNAAGGYLSILAGIKGYAATIASGFQSGINCTFYAYNLVKTKQQDMVMACGVDEYTQIVDYLYNTIGFSETNKELLDQPYDFINEKYALGEGSSSLILEDADDAISRGAKCYAEIIGFGFANEPTYFGSLNQDGKGLSRAITEACNQAGITPSDIDAVIGFGNGSKEIDFMELDAYTRVFGEGVYTVPIHNIKKYVGEGRAATSSLQIAYGALLFDSQNKANANKAYFVSKDAKKKVVFKNVDAPDYQYILITGFSYGGSYGSIILKRVEK